uniref:Uncharacterized protein n=1 Tax=Anguilla anguilla TaxID=7936 RepID=A0A0E9R859_ANGAN
MLVPNNYQGSLSPFKFYKTCGAGLCEDLGVLAYASRFKEHVMSRHICARNGGALETANVMRSPPGMR